MAWGKRWAYGKAIMKKSTIAGSRSIFVLETARRAGGA
jgi:cytochrome c5